MNKEYKEKILSIIRFGAVGVPGALIAALLFIGLTEWGEMPYWHSLIIARSTNTVINFLLQKIILFNGPSVRITLWVVMRYSIISAILIVINILLLRLLVEEVGFHYIFGQALLIIPFTIFSEKFISKIFNSKRHRK